MMKKKKRVTFPFMRFLIDKNPSKIENNENVVPFEVSVKNQIQDTEDNHEIKVNELAGDAKASPLQSVIKQINQIDDITEIKLKQLYNQLMAPIAQKIKSYPGLINKPERDRIQEAKNNSKQEYDEKIESIEKDEQKAKTLEAKSEATGKKARQYEKTAENFKKQQKGVPQNSRLNNNKVYIFLQCLLGGIECVVNFYLVQESGTVSNGMIYILVGGISLVMAYSAHAIAKSIIERSRKELWISSFIGGSALSVLLILRIFYSSGGTFLTIIAFTLFAVGISLGLQRRWYNYFIWMQLSDDLYQQRDAYDAEVLEINNRAKRDRERAKDSYDTQAVIDANTDRMEEDLGEAQSLYKSLKSEKRNSLKKVKTVSKLAIQKATDNAPTNHINEDINLKFRSNGKAKSANIGVSILLLAASLLAACSPDPDPQFTFQITLEDITPSHGKVLIDAKIMEKLTLPSSEEVSPHKYKVKFSQIDDKHLQTYSIDSIAFAGSYMSRTEQDRITQQTAFIARLEDNISTLPQALDSGLRESFVFQAIKTNANELARSSADVKSLKIWSDMCENSPPFRIYDYLHNPRSMFDNGKDEEIIKTLDKYFDEEAYENWDGINITVYYNPNKALDQLYTSARKLFRKWIESHGARISFIVMT
ncbi:hypothetical protein BFP97_06300 [Roseivirga sp. 4D4]|uniref:hypothetical protein n=1 Tax=Roseivirga sp. 4D4 TaxID=1889784 RepID=UPI000853C8DC|nr:hypothetical protein [Roseivirga sp. 4D4]OEK01142.1 hypothetical protein BFP97_06300 [Roseivirga sp. 4D4]